MLVKLEEEFKFSQADSTQQSANQKVDPDALIQETDIVTLKTGIEELKAKRQRYEDKLNALEAATKKDQKKIDERKKMIAKLDGTIEQVTAKIQEAQTPVQLSEKDRIRELQVLFDQLGPGRRRLSEAEQQCPHRGFNTGRSLAL